MLFNANFQILIHAPFFFFTLCMHNSISSDSYHIPLAACILLGERIRSYVIGLVHLAYAVKAWGAPAAAHTEKQRKSTQYYIEREVVLFPSLPRTHTHSLPFSQGRCKLGQNTWTRGQCPRIPSRAFSCSQKSDSWANRMPPPHIFTTSHLRVKRGWK